MNNSVNILAFDLGAESGRAVLGRLDRGFLRLEEVHRFANGPVRVFDSLHWDALYLWNEILRGLSLGTRICNGELTSLGVDSWGVDFALLAANDTLLGNPYHYRDKRTDGMMELAFQKVPKSEIYQTTGIQFLQLNSLYQLVAMVKTRAPALAYARAFLNIPDLFNFWLTGRKASEFTIATTTQCYDPQRKEWATDLLKKLEIPAYIFNPIVQPGTILEKLHISVAEETGCPTIPVIATAGHDTACAVAAIPATQSDYIYISSGTWSLMGLETPQPIINQASLEYNITNEGGVGGMFRILRNIMGLWLVQECRREWTRYDQTLTYDDLIVQAAAAPAFGPLIVPDDARFFPPGDMPGRIQSFCKQTGQPIPYARGEIVRCCLESLALEYRFVADHLEKLVGHSLPVVHIIGGGSRNRLLNQFTADATNRTVIAGPVEATAIGNILVQALATGQISTLAEGREIIRKSFDVSVFEPRNTSAWVDAYSRYIKLKS